MIACAIHPCNIVCRYGPEVGDVVIGRVIEVQIRLHSTNSSHKCTTSCNMTARLSWLASWSNLLSAEDLCYKTCTSKFSCIHMLSIDAHTANLACLQVVNDHIHVYSMANKH